MYMEDCRQYILMSMYIQLDKIVELYMLDGGQYELRYCMCVGGMHVAMSMHVHYLGNRVS